MTDGISSADGLSQADDVSAADGVSRDGSVPRDGISTANDILPADAISAGDAVWGADAWARRSARRIASETMRSGIADAVSRAAGGRGGGATFGAAPTRDAGSRRARSAPVRHGE